MVEPTPLKNNSQNRNLPQFLGCKYKIFETTTQQINDFMSHFLGGGGHPNTVIPPRNSTHRWRLKDTSWKFRAPKACPAVVCKVVQTPTMTCWQRWEPSSWSAIWDWSTLWSYDHSPKISQFREITPFLTKFSSNPPTKLPEERLIFGRIPLLNHTFGRSHMTTQMYAC